jgi:hypothetical protein
LAVGLEIFTNLPLTKKVPSFGEYTVDCCHYCWFFVGEDNQWFVRQKKGLQLLESPEVVIFLLP